MLGQPIPQRTPARAAHWLGVVLLATVVALPAMARDLPDFRGLIKENGPAVVNVRADRDNPMAMQGMPDLDSLPEPFRRFFEMPEGRRGPMPRQVPAAGSGFLISDDGYVLTNAHVVSGAEEVTVRLQDRMEYQAEVVGADQRTDVALLKIAADHLPTVQIGDDAELEVGDWVLAIGSPFGFEYTATQGIVSALSRSLPDGNYVPFIQTDAAVNPGNSGGPLFNLDGEVVGINSQIYSRSGGYMGLSFAIPISLAMDVVDQLKSQGFVERGWLGVAIQDMDQALAESFDLSRPRGALVAQVTEGGPAAEAGIRVGDVILGFDGQRIQRSSHLPPLVGATPVGREVPLTLLRDGDEITLQLTVGRLEETGALAAAELEEQNQGRLGLAVQELDEETRKSLGAEENRGVLVQDVRQGSPAAEAGLQPNDVILSFNQRDISSAEELLRQVENAEAGRSSVMLVLREQRTLFVPVRIPGEEELG